MIIQAPNPKEFNVDYGPDMGLLHLFNPNWQKQKQNPDNAGGDIPLSIFKKALPQRMAEIEQRGESLTAAQQRLSNTVSPADDFFADPSEDALDHAQLQGPGVSFQVKAGHINWLDALPDPVPAQSDNFLTDLSGADEFILV